MLDTLSVEAQLEGVIDFRFPSNDCTFAVEILYGAYPHHHTKKVQN